MVLVARKKDSPGGFAARLRSLREARGLTQAKLAEEAGLKRLSIVRYESGETEPAWSVVCQLAEALGITPNEFRTTPAVATDD